MGKLDELLTGDREEEFDLAELLGLDHAPMADFVAPLIALEPQSIDVRFRFGDPPMAIPVSRGALDAKALTRWYDIQEPPGGGAFVFDVTLPNARLRNLRLDTSRIDF
jgi:hypothetical protein